MRGLLAIFAAAALAAAFAGDAERTDGEVWNEGVEYYRAGDVTNALRVLRPLMLSKSHGARAAEVVAAIAHARGDREEAAAAAQIALRAAPGDAKANRNFTRAVDGLAAERETKHIEAVIKAAQGKDPGAMLREAAYESRRLLVEAGGYLTNRAERAVALSDALSRRAEKLVDVWYPLREAIAQSVTNEEQAATIVAQIEQAQAKSKAAAKDLSDMKGEAYSAMSDAEHDFTRFLKLVALPPLAVGEDLVAQSNAYLDVEAVNGREWQQDALDFTRSFRAKFPAWARNYEQQAQADTNKPPFTAEDQAKISALATELEKIQLECCEKSVPPQQLKACDILNEIRELLPKDNSGGGQGQPQSGGQQGQNQQQDQQQNQDQQQDQQSGDGEGETQGEQEEEPPEAEEAQGQEGEEEEKPEDKEIEALLKKAQERNDEHEADKKARMRKAPLPPNERDW